MTFLLTALAMIAFAANSLLARAALADDAIDPAAYTLIRLVAGMAVLVLAVAMRGRTVRDAVGGGTWAGGTALFVYAIAFSLAYLALGAATGALVLFASVQGTMIAWGILRRDRPSPVELLGIAIAFAAFVWLLLPGLHAPDPFGAALMIVAGIAWGAYSLIGRGVSDPLGASAGNFARASALSLPVALAALAGQFLGPITVTSEGILLAVLSGAVTSGLGYVIWYAALPRLSSTGAAVVQLTVPVIAAVASVALLSEPMTARLAIAAALILGGVAITILARGRRT